MARTNRCRVPVIRALAFSAALALPLPAAAQTAQQPATVATAPVTGNSTTGAGLLNRAGAVSLPTLAAPTASTASATTGTGAAAGAAGSAAGGGGRSGSNATATAAGSSGSANSTAGGSNPAPAWLVCPPAGAGGEAPFTAGTGLSCAP